MKSSESAIETFGGQQWIHQVGPRAVADAGHGALDGLGVTAPAGSPVQTADGQGLFQGDAGRSLTCDFYEWDFSPSRKRRAANTSGPVGTCVAPASRSN